MLRAKLKRINRSTGTWYYIKTRKGPIYLRRLTRDGRYIPVTRKIALACLACFGRDGQNAALPCYSDWSAFDV